MCAESSGPGVDLTADRTSSDQPVGRLVTVSSLAESTSWDPVATGEKAIREVGLFIASLPVNLAAQAIALMERHDYGLMPSSDGPNANVMGHPLFELPIWIDSATREQGTLPADVMSAISTSSLVGYLSVRAEDDFFDGDWPQPEAAMMLAGTLRAKHSALLATHVSSASFWHRFEAVWQAYAEAMLLERSLHQRGAQYGPDEFAAVLGRSQPLEIPGGAVLALKGRWDLSEQLSQLVRHLAHATQIFDDFVDAPADLEAGNYTLTVRRLGGLEGASEMRRGMVSQCDQIMAEARRELDSAADLAGAMGVDDLSAWADERRQVMDSASSAMYSALFQHLDLS